MKNRASAVLPRACAVATCLAMALPGAEAASASTSTTIRANASGVGADRTTPGATTAGVSFASDSFTQAPITFTSSASAGNGSLSTFASAFAGRDTTPFTDDGVTAANASLSDRFVVHFDGSITNKLLLDFAVHAGGSVSYTHAQNDSFKGASSTFSFSVSGLGFQYSATGGEERGLTLDFDALDQGIFRTMDFEKFTGIGLSDFQLTLEATAETANSFDLTMSSRSIASVAAGFKEGSFAAATADFGNTLRWLGLARAYLPDGTPYTGSLSITSESGFNYAQEIAAVPEPETVAMLLAGLGLLAWRVRRPTASSMPPV